MDFLHEEAGEYKNFKYGACSIQGWRSHFEDTHICQAGNFKGSDSFFAVFDGHGGAECAKFTKDNLVDSIEDFGPM
jgi:protein phosphatase 2C family protein 2/3